jgi:Na+/H+ antiporter NhaD/arsenite permease-like protein
MDATLLMIIIFVVGYACIALEHPIKIDKAASALLIGVLTWTILVFGAQAILGVDAEAAQHHIEHGMEMTVAEIGQILFFLLGAMTIVELIDAHEGFAVITDKIKTTNKVKLLWVICIITFFMSAALDNLTTSIVMVSLIRKLIADQKDRWFFGGMIVIAANAGGAWSPIGDVTTTMLWIDKQITAQGIVIKLIIPSLVCLFAPLLLLSFTMKGKIQRPLRQEGLEHYKNPTTDAERNIIFFLGILMLLFVPVFKTITHLPPFMGMLLGLGILWVVTEIMHKAKNKEEKNQLSVVSVLRKIDTPSVLFFLGILLAISSLKEAHILENLANALRNGASSVMAGNELAQILGINIIIGLLSAIVDNVPLVAAAQGMYELSPAGATGWDAYFVQDGTFWEFLAYCAGTGGSCLIIGSAAGVAVMGLEKIDFIWYLKKMSLLSLLGYLAGAAVFILMFS